VFIDCMGYLNEEMVFDNKNHILKQTGSHYIRIASSPYGNEHESTSGSTDEVRSISSGQHHGTMSADPLGMAIPEARIDRIFAGYLKQIKSWWSGINYHFILVSPEKDALLEVNQALKEGKIHPVIQQRFMMRDAAMAHLLIEQGHVVGKLLLINDNTDITNTNDTTDNNSNNGNKGNNGNKVDEVVTCR
jgi:hypothetical protein